MTTLTVPEFMQLIRERGLLPSAQLQDAENLAQQTSDTNDFVAELIRRQYLTPGQAEEISQQSSNPFVTAEEPLPTSTAITTEEPRSQPIDDLEPPTIVLPRARARSRAPLVLVLLLVVVLLSCPVAVIGVSMLGVGFFTLAPHAGDVAVENGAGGAAAGEVAAEENAGLELRRLDEVGFGKLKHLDGQAFYLSRDGSRIIHGAAMQYQVRELETGNVVFRLPDGYVPFGFATGQPPHVVAHDQNNVVHILDGNTGKERKQFPILEDKVRLARVMPDGKSALILQGTALTRWNLEEGTEAQHLAFDASDVSDFAIARSGDELLVGTEDAKVQLWSLRTGEILRAYPGALFGVSRVALSPNGRRILACCDNDVLLWERDDPQQRAVIDNANTILSAAFVRDDRLLISIQSKTGGVVSYADAVTGARSSTFRIESALRAVAFHPDGRRAISTHEDDTIRIWNLPK